MARKTTKKRSAVVRRKTPTKCKQSADEPKLMDVVQKLKLELPSGERYWILSVPFEERGIVSIFKGKWDPNLHQFLYRGTKLPQQLEAYQSEDYSWERFLEDRLNPTPTQTAVSPNTKFTPYPHQQEAIDSLVSFAKKGWRGYVLADDVGLGKTLEALEGARQIAKVKGYTAANPGTMLIFCINSSVPHWRNTIANLNIDNLTIVLANYEKMKRFLDAPSSASQAKKTRTKNRLIANNGTPIIGWDIIIADESHKLKNIYTSQTPKAFANLAQYKKPAKQSPFVIWCSATTGQNPLELGYLAPLIGQALNKKGLGLREWGNFLSDNGFHVSEGKVGWNWIRPSKEVSAEEVEALHTEDIKRLNKLLFSSKFPSIHRDPSQIKGWPKCVPIPVPIDLNPAQYALYLKAWTEFQAYYKLHGLHKDPKGGFAETLRFRQKSSLLHLQQTVDFVEDMVDNGRQVFISVAFLDTIHKLSEAFAKDGYKSTFMTGENVEDREQERLRFQKGEVPIIISNVKESISLHAEERLADGTLATSNPRVTVVHDLHYSALECKQINGRCAREGKRADAYYMYSVGTIEEKILPVVLKRMKNASLLSGSGIGGLTEIEDLIKKFA